MTTKRFPGLTFSTDQADWPKELSNGYRIDFTVRNIRREKTGMHAFVAITSATPGADADNVDILAHTNFNIERDEHRTRLVNSAYKMVENGLKETYSSTDMKRDIDALCLWLARKFEEQRVEVEYWNPAEAYEAPPFVLEPYLLDGAGTIVYGPPGAGKSMTCQAMGLCIVSGNQSIWTLQQRPVIYVNLERPKNSMNFRESKLRETLGIDPNDSPERMGYIHARGMGLKQVSKRLKRFAKENPNGVVILDSISRTGLGDLVSNETANSFTDIMNGLGLTWLGIAHMPHDGDHIFGAMHYGAGADITVQLNGDEDGDVVGIKLETKKANDTGKGEHSVSFLAMEFVKGQGLISFRKAQSEEFVKFAAELKGEPAIMQYLLDNGRSTYTTMLANSNIDKDAVYVNMKRLKEKGMVVQFPNKEWAAVEQPSLGGGQ